MYVKVIYSFSQNEIKNPFSLSLSLSLCYTWMTDDDDHTRTRQSIVNVFLSRIEHRASSIEYRIELVKRRI